MNTPCPHCGGRIVVPDTTDQDSPQPVPINRSTELCTCPSGPLWLELLNVVPLFFRLEEGQKLYPLAFKTDRRIPIYHEETHVYKLFTPTQFRGWVIKLLRTRDERREELLLISEQQNLPMPINEIVQHELSRRKVNLKTGAVSERARDVKV